MANEVKIVVKAADEATNVLKGISGGLLGIGLAAASAAAAFAGLAFAAGN
jgi:hypothetical protein